MQRRTLNNYYPFHRSLSLNRQSKFLRDLKNSLVYTTVLFTTFLAVTMAYSNAFGAEGSYIDDENQVVMKYDPQYMETHYSISKDTCSVRWTVHESEVNKGIVQNRSSCDLALKIQLPLLSKILGEILKDEHKARSLRTLYWGRLTPDGRKASLEMSFRLAMAAYESPQWDSKLGQPKTGHENDFVEGIANEALIYSELKELFEHFNRIIVFSNAEKVLIVEAEKLPFFNQIKKHGVRATDRLPYDCITWFSVSKIGEQ